jgi:hypothetical protein
MTGPNVRGAAEMVSAEVERSPTVRGTKVRYNCVNVIKTCSGDV